MKRFAWRLIAVLFVIAAGCWTAAIWQRREEEKKWQRLIESAGVKVYAVTCGTNHCIQWPVSPIGKRLPMALNVLRHGSLYDCVHILQGYDRGSSSSTSTTPSTTIWLQIRNRRGSGLARDAILELSDGQKFRGGDVFGSGGGNEVFISRLGFPFVPFREKKVRFSADFDGQRVSFEAPNPGYNPNVQRWESVPLPQTQTQTQSGITLTLKDLTIRTKQSRPDSMPEVQPVWEIRSGDVAANDWFRINCDYVDAGGNVFQNCGVLSEPAWKIRATLKRTGNYPFLVDEIHWIATIQPAASGQVEPQKYSLFQLDQEVQKQGVLLAGIFGAGEANIVGGAVTGVGPAVRQPYRSGYRTNYDANTKGVQVTLVKPGFILLRNSNCVLVFQKEGDAPAKWRPAWAAGGPWGDLQIYELPTEATRVGVADPGSLSFEFLVRPPTSAPLAATREKRP